MVIALGELKQGFATRHRVLLTLKDFVSTEPAEQKLNKQYGAIPWEIWGFIREHGEQGKSLVRQWYSDNGELIDDILGTDPVGDRERDVQLPLYDSAKALVDALLEHVVSWSEPASTPRVIEGDELAYSAPG